MSNRSLTHFYPRRLSHRLFDNINSEIARLFDEYDSEKFTQFENTSDGVFLPTKLDYSESDDSVEVIVEIPGVKEKDVDVELNGRILTISAKRETHSEDEKKNYRIVERRSGSFRRELALDFDPDPAKVKANTDAGVLTVTLEKPEESKSSKQKIKVESKTDLLESS